MIKYTGICSLAWALCAHLFLVEFNWLLVESFNDMVCMSPSSLEDSYYKRHHIICVERLYYIYLILLDGTRFKPLPKKLKLKKTVKGSDLSKHHDPYKQKMNVEEQRKPFSL